MSKTVLPEADGVSSRMVNSYTSKNSYVYDYIVNPGHWTKDMREDDLSVAQLNRKDLKVCSGPLSTTITSTRGTAFQPACRNISGDVCQCSAAYTTCSVCLMF